MLVSTPIDVLKRRLLTAFWLILFSAPVRAEDTPAPAEQSAGASSAENVSPFSGSVGATYIHPIASESEALASYALGLGWRLSDLYSLRLSQGITHFFSVNPGEFPLEAGDTQISVRKRLEERLFDYQGSTSAGLTLPISRSSRRNEVRSRPSLGLSFSRPYGSFEHSLGASIAGYWNRYKTAKPSSRRGGQSLPMFSANISTGLSFPWSDKWATSASLSYGVIRYENSRQGTSDQTYLQEHPYSVDLSTNYSVEQWDFGAGFSQSNNLEAFGGLSLYFYDESTSSFFLSIGRTF